MVGERHSSIRHAGGWPIKNKGVAFHRTTRMSNASRSHALLASTSFFIPRLGLVADPMGPDMQIRLPTDHLPTAIAYASMDQGYIPGRKGRTHCKEVRGLRTIADKFYEDAGCPPINVDHSLGSGNRPAPDSTHQTRLKG